MTYKRIPARQANAPVKMTREYNRITALSKVDTAPLDKLDDTLLASIARSHGVAMDVLQARLAERRAREGAHG